MDLLMFQTIKQNVQMSQELLDYSFIATSKITYVKFTLSQPIPCDGTQHFG